MAFKVPDTLAGSGGLSVEGDVEIDAFSNTARIVSLPAASFPEMPAGTFIANITAADAVPTFHPLATFAGVGLTYTNISGVLDWDGISVRKNSTGSVFTRRRINLIEGTNITFTVADDAGDDEVDITITSSGGGGSQGWDDTLAIDNHSGTNNVFVDAGQYLNLGTTTPTQVTGDIRASGNLLIHPDTGFEVHAHDAIYIHGPDAINIECTGGSDITLTTSTDIELVAGGDVDLEAGTYVDIVNGFIRFSEQAASTPSMTAGFGLLWLKDDAPNRPMFTDDTDTDFRIALLPLPLTDLANQADDTFLANISGGSAPPTAVALTTLAGAGLTGGADAILAVGAGTGITVNANDVQLATIADDTFMANVSGGAAVATGKTFASLAGLNITYDATAHELDWDGVDIRKNSAGSVFTRPRINLIEGSGVTLTVADDAGDSEVDVTIAATATGLSAIADQRVLGNDSGSSAVPTATTVHQVLDWIAGAGGWIFDGVDDHVNFGNTLGFERTDSHTYGFWFQTTQVVAGYIFNKQNIAASRHGPAVFIQDNGQIFMNFNNNSGGANDMEVRTDLSYNDGNLHHCLISYGGTGATSVNFYIDGALVAKTIIENLLSTTLITASDLLIGWDGVGFAFEGILRDLAQWTVACTLGDAAAIFAAGIGADYTTLGLSANPVHLIRLDGLDTTGANGILDYGTSSTEGTAGGGFAPLSGTDGAIPVRGSTQWQLIQPTTAGLPLVSNGPGNIPTYEQLSITALPSIATDTFLANVTAASAIPTAHSLATFAGAGLTYTGVTGILAVGSSTSITVNANDVQRAALTGAITASANSNTTAFGTLAAKAVLANATNVTAVPAALAGSAAFQYLRVNSANTALEWAVLALAAFPTMAAGSFLANVTAGTAVPTAHDLATFAGAGLTYTNVTGIMAVGAGTGITVNANDVQLATIAAESFFVNGTAGAAVPTAIAGTIVAGAGLTYTTGGILAVGAGTGITVNANDVAITAGGITPAMVQVITSSTAIGITIYTSFAAGAGGSADDVSIFTSNAPFNFRILEVIVYTTTAVASSTVTLRSATGGLGSALSSAISTTVAGQTSNNNTATTTVASASSLIVRRSDSGVAGEVVIFAVKT
jgi:hypothetical protein